MKQFDYTPVLKVDDKSKKLMFEGKVKIKLLPYVERLKLLKERGFEIKGAEVSVGGSSLNAAIIMAEIARDHVLDVNVKRVADKVVFKSLDDLEYDSDGVSLINEIAGVILGGVKLGKV